MFRRTVALMLRCTALPLKCSITKCAFFVAMRSSSECTSSPTRSIASLPICSSPFSMYCIALTSLLLLTIRWARNSGLLYSGSIVRTAAVPLPLSTAWAWWFATVRGVIRLYTRGVFLCSILMIVLYHYCPRLAVVYVWRSLIYTRDHHHTRARYAELLRVTRFYLLIIIPFLGLHNRGKTL